jgi:3-oxoacyl-[acyl-carrier-protein] synthase II
VPDFDIAEQLGRKGTRSMDRMTGLAVTTVGALMAADGAPEPGDEVALVLGTTTGSAQSMMDFTRDSLTAEKPFFVDPARFPNTVMNCAAGQCAIRYDLRGPNTTVAGGRVSALHALTYARRLLDAGRAGTVLVGAVEEYSPARSWLEHHARRLDGGRQNRPPAQGATVLGEGCVVLRLDAVHRAPLAYVLAVRCGVSDGDDPGPALRSCVRRALLASGAAPGDIWAAVAGDGSDAEAGVLADYAPHAEVVSPIPADLIGDTGAAAAAFQIAAALALAERDPHACGRLVLITSTDRGGGVGCALLRLA